MQTFFFSKILVLITCIVYLSLIVCLGHFAQVLQFSPHHRIFGFQYEFTLSHFLAVFVYIHAYTSNHHSCHKWNGNPLPLTMDHYQTDISSKARILRKKNCDGLRDVAHFYYNTTIQNR